MATKSLNQCKVCNNWFTTEGANAEKILYCHNCLAYTITERKRNKNGEFLDEIPNTD